MFLNLPRLYDDSRDMEPEKPGHQHRLQLSGIEPPRDSIECVGQRAVGCDLLAAAEALTGTGGRYPHEVPTSLANHGVEDRSLKIVKNHPVSTDRLLGRVQLVWQDASIAEENRMQLHACALLDTASIGTVPRPGSIAAESVLSPLDVGRSVDAWATWPVGDSTSPDSTARRLLPLDWFSDG